MFGSVAADDACGKLGRRLVGERRANEHTHRHLLLWTLLVVVGFVPYRRVDDERFVLDVDRLERQSMTGRRGVRFQRDECRLVERRFLGEVGGRTPLVEPAFDEPFVGIFDVEKQRRVGVGRYRRVLKVEAVVVDQDVFVLATVVRSVRVVARAAEGIETTRCDDEQPTDTTQQCSPGGM